MKSKTIKDRSDRTIIFGVEDFIGRICNGNSCFVCGAVPGDAAFNDEHVIPRWILKRFNLFSASLTLPNGNQQKYGTYTMRCCNDCNSLLGQYVEQPLSELLSGGFAAVDQRLRDPDNGLARIKDLYVWLCLLFIKTHLKDRELRKHLDRRNGDASISEQYDWELLHHIHCVARLPYVQGEIDPGVIGTLQWFYIEDSMVVDQFDYFDLTSDHTLVLRLGDLGVVAVLTDGRKCSQMLRNVLSEVEGETLTMVQLRELGARLALANRQLINKPRFYTAVDRRSEPSRVSIGVRPNPGLECEALDHDQLGQVMLFALRQFLNNLQIDGVASADKVAEEIGRGRSSFFLDEDLRFMSRSIAKPSS